MSAHSFLQQNGLVLQLSSVSKQLTTVDYGLKPCYILTTVEEIAISKFKATCLSVPERVRRTRTPVSITKFGEPVAQVIPPPVAERPARWLGAMAGTVRINGDIFSPASNEEDWEVLSS